MDSKKNFNTIKKYFFNEIYLQINKTALCYAIEEDKYEIIKLLLAIDKLEINIPNRI